MAVLPSLPGLHVEIHDATNNEQSLAEYDDPDSNSAVMAMSNAEGNNEDEAKVEPSKKRRRKTPYNKNTMIIKYIETGDVVAMRIRIRIRFEPDAQTRAFYNGYSLQAKIYLDGNFAEDSLYSDTDIPANDDSEGIQEFISGIRRWESGTGWTERPFQLSELMIDSDSHEKPREAETDRLHKVGSIKVEMHRVQILGRNNLGAKIEFQDLQVHPEETHPENPFKARGVSHGISVADPKSSNRPDYCSYTYVDNEADPFATFIFHYRTQGIHIVPFPSALTGYKCVTDGIEVENLKALGIIARTPPPIPLEELPFDQLTDEQIRALARRRQEDYRRHVAMKSEFKQERGG